ncbi:MAG: hypothetical protein ACTIKR_07950 [Advenella sp.]|uniref:hypothetical protein n=1 Tax=Advenella sp. TaxID=1872388 RepID=UPI003F9B4554
MAPWSGTWATTNAAILQRPYPYVIIEQDLRDVLVEFGRNIGVATEISKKVNGVVRGRAQSGDTAASFLHRIGADHDLVWYLDRDTLFVSTQQDNKTEGLSLAQVGMKRRLAVVQEWSKKGKGVQVETLIPKIKSLVAASISGLEYERVSVIPVAAPVNDVADVTRMTTWQGVPIPEKSAGRLTQIALFVLAFVAMLTFAATWLWQSRRPRGIRTYRQASEG